MRFVWQGNWTTGYGYVKDDVVRVGGKTYVCVIGHTASAAFATDLNAVPTKWNQVTDGSNWTGNWATNTQYNLNDLVKYGGNVYICSIAHTSAATATSGNSPDLTAGLEVDLAKWTVYASSFNWIGTWTNSYRYKANDVVKYGGETYVCNVGHTSATSSLATTSLATTSASASGGTATIGFATQGSVPFKIGTGITIANVTPTAFNGTWTVTNCTTSQVQFALAGTYGPQTVAGTVAGPILAGFGLEVDQAKWTLFADGFSWQGSWITSNYYRVNDLVSYGGYLYVCNTGHTSANTTTLGLEANQSYWDYYHKGFSYLGNWSASSVRYKINDIVAYGGDNWICIAPHTSSATFATANWSRFVEGLSYINTWNSSTTYQPGDIVGYGGYTYIAESVNTNVTPSTDVATPTVLTITAATSTASVATLTVASGGTAFTSGQTITVAGVTPTGYNGQYTVIGTPTATQIQYAINNGPLGAGSAFGTVTSNNWLLFVTGYKLIGDWATSQSYQVGNVVRNGGYTYVCILDHTSGAGNQMPNVTYWSKLNSGVRWNAAVQNFTSLSPTNVTVTNGSAAGATFSVTTNGTAYTVTKTANGTNYTAADVIKILGSNVGGITPFNDITITVNSVTTGGITTFTATGFASTWATAQSYVAGDTVVYGPNSYICILAHTSSTPNRPDNDLTAVYWNLIAAGASTSILTTQGDLPYYGSSGATRLPIGTTGQVLKVSPTGFPIWGTFGLINNVYYVSNANGVDSPAPGYGQTLDRPWKTIAYAAKQVFNGTAYPNASYLLNQNKAWMIAEMYNWMIYQKVNSVSPYSPTSSYDQYKASRDAGLIVDSIIYDITRGGNSQTVASALAFFKQGSTNTFYNTNIAAQVAFYVAALNRLSTLTGNALAQTTPTAYQAGITNYQSASGGTATLSGLGITGITSANGLVTFTFASQTNAPFAIGETITVASVNPSAYNASYKVVAYSQTSVTVSSTVTSTYVSGGTIAGSAITQVIDANYPAEAGATSLVSSYISIITTALTNVSTTGIPASNAGATSTIFIKNGTYNEVLPITVPENVALVGDELRGVIVQPLPTQGIFTGSVSTTTLTSTAITAVLSSQSISATSVGTYGTTGTGGVVTVASTLGLLTGHVFVVTGTGSGGLSAGTYYVGNVITSTTLNLSTNFANALAGTYIAFTNSSPSATTFTAYGSIIAGSFLTGSATITAPLQITQQLTGATGTATTSQTFNGTSGAFTITLSSSNASIVVGQFVSGNGATISGIPGNTFVTAVSGTTVTLSNEITTSFTGFATTLYFFTAGQTGTYSIPSSGYTIGSTTLTAGYLTSNMFYVRNGSGVRNMTLYGLTGSVGTPATISSGSITATTASTYGTGTNPTGGFITIASTAGFSTGNTFTISGTAGNGLTATTYYVGTVINSTTLTLATSYNNAIAGTFVTLTTNASYSGTTYVLTYGTSRPTAGAYVSLDPGTGPADSTAWIFRKSPYVQNVTTFGTGCVGCKVDGTLHNGGNKSIVANDFTHVLSDGIGFWVYGPNALSELVSVFTYYNQIGYLAEAGAKIRATNGNSSYGSYGVVAEGYDVTESTVTATINNRYSSPIIGTVVTDAVNKVYRVEFTNAGQNANSATFAFASSGGYNLSTVGNEFRDNAVFETRWLTAGANYVTTSNTAQNGTLTYITIAATDQNISSVYVGMRLLVTGGTSAGVTGWIASYNNGSKIALMAKESFTTLTVTGTTTGTASATGIISAGANVAGLVFIPTGTITGSFVPGMFLTSSGTITAGTYITAVTAGTINSATIASTVVSSTGTIGSISGTGPWTATITGMSTTTGLIVGAPITATSGSGTLYGGSPTSVIVTSIVSQTSITYRVTGGTIPTAGTVTNISTTVLTAGASSSGILAGAVPSGGAITAGTYVVGQLTTTGTATVTATFTGTSGQSTLTLSSYTVGNSILITVGMFVAPISGIPAGTYVTAVNMNANTITINTTLVGAVSGSTSLIAAGGSGTYGLNQTATGTPTASATYLVSASQLQTSATITGTQNTLTIASTATIYNGMPIYLSATTGTNLSALTLYYAIGVVPNSTVFSVNTASNSTSGLTVTTTTGQTISLYAAGWDHVVPGTYIQPTLTIDTTSTYIIEPRLTFTSPTYTANPATQTSAAWVDCVYGDINGTYSTISATGGTGTLATFTVVRTGNAYSVTLVNGGQNYTIGDTLTLAGTSLGGASPANSVTITVTNTTTTSFSGVINNFTYTGQGQGGNYVAIAGAATTTQYSTNGTTWTAGGALPSSGPWTSVAYGVYNGVGTWVAVANGSNTPAVSTNGGVTWTAGGTLGVAVNWSSITYGNGVFVAVQNGGTNSVYSTTGGSSWITGGGITALSSANWTSVAYGNGTWVAIASGGTTAAYCVTANPTTWVASTSGLPSTQNWTSVTFGKGRFVAVAAGTNVTAYSFDGNTWYAGTYGLPTTQNWTKVRYGQGLFFATTTDTTANAATSEDGIFWTLRALGSAPAGGWPAIAFGNPGNVPLWTALTTGSTVFNSIVAGCTAQARTQITGGGTTTFRMVEPGSGYASAPTMTITDPNPTVATTWTVRTGNGVLANPTFVNRGTAYATATATVTTNGIADVYQPGSYINVAGLTVNPTAGANVQFAGNSGIYKLVQVTNFIGTGGGLSPYVANFQINPALTTTNAPTHGTTITLRLKYSQVRLTGHDFLSVGTGNFVNTNYPGTPLIASNSNYQTVSNNGGRTFFTSTDQDGNFNVGNLFSVQQATGVTTLNASAFNVAGLNSLTIGAVSLGTNSATITSFSTDPYFTANSDNILPTQKAIKSYITAQIGGGGSSLNVNTLTAGSLYLAGNTISTGNNGIQIKVANKMYFVGGIDGSPLALNFLLLN